MLILIISFLIAIGTFKVNSPPLFHPLLNPSLRESQRCFQLERTSFLQNKCLLVLIFLLVTTRLLAYIFRFFGMPSICPVCSKNCYSSQNVVECTSCKNWIHHGNRLRCSGLTDVEFQDHTLDEFKVTLPRFFLFLVLIFLKERLSMVVLQFNFRHRKCHFHLLSLE